MDLRKSTLLGDVIDKVPGGGYDYNFCLPEKSHKADKNRFVAEVEHASSGRYMTVHSNQPGVQLYTANSLPANNATGILGKNGKRYFRHGALCLETQNYPDAVNHVSSCFFFMGFFFFLYESIINKDLGFIKYVYVTGKLSK